jgi:hypothetical protein
MLILSGRRVTGSLLDGGKSRRENCELLGWTRLRELVCVSFSLLPKRTARSWIVWDGTGD